MNIASTTTTTNSCQNLKFFQKGPYINLIQSAKNSAGTNKNSNQSGGSNNNPLNRGGGGGEY